MKLISVIIPAYNAENTIKETITSVLKQTFTNWELIIIDDGSTDSTLDISSSFTDSRIKIFSYPHAGGNVSRNRGFQHTVGSFISFLDADDLWTPDKLESQFKALQANPQASVAYSWTDYIDENNSFLVSGTHITRNGDVYESLLINNFLENGSNPLIRREALIKLDGFDESLSAGQDWDMWLRLAANYHFVAVSSVQILYRVSSHSVSSKLERQEKACLHVLEKAYKIRPSSFTDTWNKSLTHIYKYLTCRALQKPLNRQKSGSALRFLCKYFINDNKRLQNLFFTFKILCKIIIIIICNDFPTALLTKKGRENYQV
ncbi:MAG: glycosyltransferase [Calothrix sp. MO_192.B10]|nr:glycosyltransferase [Calothrix sp. MO_192.B10]